MVPAPASVMQPFGVEAPTKERRACMVAKRGPLCGPSHTIFVDTLELCIAMATPHAMVQHFTQMLAARQFPTSGIMGGLQRQLLEAMQGMVVGMANRNADLWVT